jgi:hypothetical protein
VHFIALNQARSGVNSIQRKISMNVHKYIAESGEEIKEIGQKLREEKIKN